jgi:hypothetical protein
MSATVRAGATGASGSGGINYAITETAANPQAGDIRFLFAMLSANITVTPPTGWTTVFNGQVGARTLFIMSRTWAAGVGSQTLTSGNSFYAIELVSVAGADTAASPQLSTNGSSTASTSPTATGLTPATADGLALGFFAIVLASGATTATISTPSGMTLVNSVTSPTAQGYDHILTSKAITSTAATGDFVATSTSAPWQAALLLVPSASGVTNPGQWFPFLRI